MATITYAGATETSITVNIGQNATANMDNWKVFLNGSSNKTGSFPVSQSHSAQVTVTNLQPSTQYQISVYYYMGTTQVGTGASDYFSTNAPPAPGSVNNLYVSVSGYAPATITASWSAPSSGGAPTGYNWNYTGASSNSGAVTSPGKTVSGVSPAGFYDFHVTPYNAAGNGPQSSYSFAVDAAPISPPSGTPSVSATGGYKAADVSWTAVSGQNVIYEVYAADITLGTGYFLKSTTTGTSAHITLDREWTNYSIEVRPYNEAGYANTGSTTVRTLDSTVPYVDTVTASTITATTVTVSVNAYDTMPTSGNASGIRDYEYYKGTTASSLAYYGTSANSSMTFTGLTVNTMYYFGVKARDNNPTPNVSTRKDISAKTIPNRPENWEWFYTKTRGADFNITADEWTAFLIRLNDFREYKQLAKVTFPTYSTGDDFTADAYNLAANHVDAVSGRAQQYYNSGDDIPASAINKLRDDLNSVP